MNSLERVMAAVTGAPFDRRPLSLTLSLYGARLIGAQVSDYFRDPSLYVAGQEAVARRFDPDIVFGPFALPLEGEAYGSSLVWPSLAPPNVKRPYGSAKDAAKLAVTRAEDSPGLAFLVDSTRRLAERWKGEKPVAAVLAAPVDLPSLIIGLDAWLEALLFDEPLADAILEFATAHFIGMARACFAAGATLVASPVMLVNPKLLTRDLIERMTLPALSRAFAEAGGPLVFHHGASPIGSSLSLYKNLPGLLGFVIDQRDEFAAARQSLGPEKLILGGFSGPLMERCAPAVMGKLARQALEAMGEDPRAILASTAADIPWNTAEETIDAVIAEVAKASRQ